MATAQFQLLASAVAGWVNRHQQEVIEYLQEENRVLREQLGGRRLSFTDAQRRRLGTVNLSAQPAKCVDGRHCT